MKKLFLLTIALIAAIVLSGCVEEEPKGDLVCGNDKSCFAGALRSCRNAKYFIDLDYTLTENYEIVKSTDTHCVLHYRKTYFGNKKADYLCNIPKTMLNFLADEEIQENGFFMCYKEWQETT
jgi:hypothetical protein